jgi:hypothetical protein
VQQMPGRDVYLDGLLGILLDCLGSEEVRDGSLTRTSAETVLPNDARCRALTAEGRGDRRRPDEQRDRLNEIEWSCV